MDKDNVSFSTAEITSPWDLACSLIFFLSDEVNRCSFGYASS